MISLTISSLTHHQWPYPQALLIWPHHTVTSSSYRSLLPNNNSNHHHDLTIQTATNLTPPFWSNLLASTIITPAATSPVASSPFSLSSSYPLQFIPFSSNELCLSWPGKNANKFDWARLIHQHAKTCASHVGFILLMMLDPTLPNPLRPLICIFQESILKFNKMVLSKLKHHQ